MILLFGLLRLLANIVSKEDCHAIAVALVIISSVHGRDCLPNREIPSSIVGKVMSLAELKYNIIDNILIVK